VKEHYLVDTHVWLWYGMGNESRLRPPIADRLTALDREQRLCLSVMSVWELGMLVAKQRMQLDCDTGEWVDTFFCRTRFRLIPLDIGSALEANALPGDFHADPADRLIAATARHHRLALITDDRKILDYARQGHLRAHATGDKELLST